MWVLETELSTSGRGASALNHRAMSLADPAVFCFQTGSHLLWRLGQAGLEAETPAWLWFPHADPDSVPHHALAKSLTILIPGDSSFLVSTCSYLLKLFYKFSKSFSFHLSELFF